MHLCRRRTDGALVILKEIPVEQMTRDERLAAQNECQVLKLLNHPNIIEYYENFLEDKALMIAMEYAPGTDIFSLFLQAHKCLWVKFVNNNSYICLSKNDQLFTFYWL